MSPMLTAARAGLSRGAHELRQTFTNAQDIWGYVFAPLAFTVVMIFMRGHTVPGTGFSLGVRTLPSAVGMGIVIGGLVTLSMALIVEREDGTLLRAKAIPNGMFGYLVGKLVLVSGMTIIGVALQLSTGLRLFDGFALSSVSRWLLLAAVVVLGLVGVLLAWAAIGLIVAPIVLRRMARRESGSSVSARREAAMQRIR